mgnify:FL=1
MEPLQPERKSDEVEYIAIFNKSKHAEHNFLSNFHEHPVQSDIGTFKCSEGLYQYLKFDHLQDKSLKEQFQQATGQEAFDLSRPLIKDGKANRNWDKVKVMKDVLRLKFSDKELKESLLATKSAYLVENGPTGHDPFWSDNGNGTGKNMLGHVLMEIRKELGGEGVVPVPEILKYFYQQKCTLCTNNAHFTNKRVIYNYCDYHMCTNYYDGNMTYELKLGNFTLPITLGEIPDGVGRYLYFKTNDIDGLVLEGARLIAERIGQMGLKNPYFVTSEVSTIAIAHRLRTEYKIDGVILGKSKKPTDVETFSINYSATTTNEKRTLYIDKLQAKSLEGKDIVLLDNVTTTGETLRAVYELLIKAQVKPEQIKEAIVLFTEGEDINHLQISKDIKLNVHRFTFVPLYPTDPSVDKSRYRLQSTTTITTEHGDHTLAVYLDRTGSSIRDALAFYPVGFLDKEKKDVVVRVQASCVASEVLGSLDCDCKLQVSYAKEYIAKNGGIIIYLNQEGRGLGPSK